MARGNPELDAAAAPYIAVRVTDLRDVDVANVRFDFDLTFAVLLLHADGTVYHRFGGRDASGPDRYAGVAALAALLRDTLAEHRAYDRAPSPPPRAEPMRAIDLPVLKQKLAGGQRIDCVHCHMVHDAEARDAMLGKRWRRDDAYVFPDPARIGLTLDPQRQARVTAVAKGSPAAAAGIAAGDELVALGGESSVRTLADVQWALHRAPSAAHELTVRLRRPGDATVREAALRLPDGWKRCPPEDYAWRPLKWNLSPSPGFGGPALDAAERQRLGLPAATQFAMRVQYVIDWGEHAARGRAARTAGLRKGDVVLAFAGKRDFTGFGHLHAWCALTLTAGADTPIVVWRDGAEHTLRYLLPE